MHTPIELTKVRGRDGKFIPGFWQYYTPTAVVGFMGRYQIHPTDNANARAIGKRPKWTVTDLHTKKWSLCDTLAEAREWIANEENKPCPRPTN